ncbi:hypothetical protein ACP4OV_015268 [Aristida adscensionis]
MAEKIIEEADSSEIVSPKSLQSSVEPTVDEDHHNNLEKTGSANFEASMQQELSVSLISTDNKSNVQDISVEQKVPIGDSITLSPGAENCDLLSTNEVHDGFLSSCSEAYESKEAQYGVANFEAPVQQELPMSLTLTDDKSNLQEISDEQKVPIGDSVTLSPKPDNNEWLSTNEVPDGFPSSSSEAYESKEAQDGSSNSEALMQQKCPLCLISTDNKGNLQEMSVEQKAPIVDSVTLSPKSYSELLSSNEVPEGFPSSCTKAYESMGAQDDSITLEPSEANVFAESQSLLRLREGVQYHASSTDSVKVPGETTPVILKKLKEDKPLVVHSSHKRQMSLRDTRQKVPAPVRSISGNYLRTDKTVVDTTTHIESVKVAASKFGGSINWKARRTQPAQESGHIKLELDKVKEEISECKRQIEAAEAAKLSVHNEFERTKKLIDELKHVLERQEAEELDANEDLQFFQFIVQVTEEGTATDDSAVIKEKLKTIQERHTAVVGKLMLVKDESRKVQENIDSLLLEQDNTTRSAEAAFTMCKDAERQVMDLTVELNQLKGALDLAHAICRDAKEHKKGTSMVRDEDCLTWGKDLRQAEDELNQFNSNLSSIEELKLKLATSSSLFLKLSDELAAYMEANPIEEAQDQGNGTHESTQEVIPSRNELEEHRKSIAKTTDELCALKVTAASFRSELKKEKAALATMQQKEAMASINISSLKLEIKMSQQELEAVQAKVAECQDRMVELPKVLQDAALEADNAKSMATKAQENLKMTMDEMEQAKAALNAMESRVQAVLRDIESAKESERLALNALRALEGTTLASNIEQESSSETMTLDLYEYAYLIEKSHRADALVQERTSAAVAQVEAARYSESHTLSRLNEVYKALDERKQALLKATEQADGATEGKLAMEQELRKWREENRKRRRTAGEDSKAEPKPSNAAEITVERGGDTRGTSKEDSCASVHPLSDLSGRSSPSDLVVLAKPKKAKKLTFFPRCIMFLARKRLKAAK